MVYKSIIEGDKMDTYEKQLVERVFRRLREKGYKCGYVKKYSNRTYHKYSNNKVYISCTLDKKLDKQMIRDIFMKNRLSVVGEYYSDTWRDRNCKKRSFFVVL